MPSFYLGRLNILPESEEVKVNGRRLQRNVDYMMIYEVGSIEIFKELDEYDEITIDYEYMPFGGQFQQTIAGVWLEYSFTPRKRKSQNPEKHSLIYTAMK
jgi:cell surface protein SprA